MRRAWLVGCLITVSGCTEALDQRLAIIDEPRILAIRSEPAEARPGSDATYTALVVGPAGPIAASPTWAYCTSPKPPTEDNAVSPRCLEDGVTVVGTSAEITATLPMDGCLTHGPDTPDGGFRPRDPDATGGYYQPIRATIEDEGDVEQLIAIGESRIVCNLANAPTEIAAEYRNEYVANVNPIEVSLIVNTVVAAGSTVELRAAWPADSAEEFLYYDPVTQTLLRRRESMRLAWFATSGHLDVDGSIVAENDEAASVSTAWRAPDEPAMVWLVIVLRDSRGGIATATVEVEVQ